MSLLRSTPFLKCLLLAGLIVAWPTQAKGPAKAATPAKAQDDGRLQQEIEHQLRTTTVNTVTDYPGEPDTYRSDARPDTLEVVFLTRDGKSEVRPDGEVLFLAADVSDADQQTLIARAFKLRAQRALAAAAQR